ncbi:MAG: Uma2 family endonuclease [Candidatus Tectomicrobia bacterium]|uniref:Uma2 family endonuclease n=1 Tax=Tectimicrobiota bacterium TaxID=2528274 RepID=A0A938B2Y7_UNCTE|nr:Uma2 family endonuclease [Candidatus Tectomicrobia bacterium]
MALAVQEKARTAHEIYYPESDGKPMAENTLQFEWIVTIKENLDALLPDAFVAGDLFWYPQQGNNRRRQAPDILVAFGRPKGHRGSYKQWEEGDIAPQVVFEILSPGNRAREMRRKAQFYEQYGVEEYYVYDPDHNTLSGWHRVAGGWQPMDTQHGWQSPRLGVRFTLTPETLRIQRPDGSLFETFAELTQRAAAARQEQEAAQAQAAAAQAQAAAAWAQVEQERQTISALRAELARLQQQGHTESQA